MLASSTSYQLTAGQPFGATVTGLDLSTLNDPDTADALVRDLAHHRLIVFPDQNLSHEDHVRVSRFFGPLDVYPVASHVVPEFPEVLKISNIFQNGQPIGLYDGDDQMEWHTDYSWRTVTSHASLLYSVIAPSEGGDTLFADTTTAYADLPAPLKERIQDLRAVHSMAHLVETERKSNPHKAPLTAQERERMPDVEHPLVRLHPLTRRHSLLLGSMIISHVVGLDRPAGEDLLGLLHGHATADRYVYRHHWRVGDVVLWDNEATMHTRTPCRREHHRLLYRTTVLWDAPAT